MKTATVYSECSIDVFGVTSTLWEGVEDTQVGKICIGNDEFTLSELRARIGQQAADWLVDQLVGDWGDIDWDE